MVTSYEGIGLVVVDDEESRAAARAAWGSSGQGDVMRHLQGESLALAERKRVPSSYDHAFLARYEGTDLVQWQARSDGGVFRPFGALLRITGLTALNA